MIIVSHVLYLRMQDGSDFRIPIDIYQPEQGEGCWTCRYDVGWPEGLRIFRSVGHDSLQALVLALQMISAEIYSSTYHVEGRLRAYDSIPGYGFPVASSLQDLAVGLDAM